MKLVVPTMIWLALLGSLVYGQNIDQFIKDDGIVSPVHKRNVGKIIFTPGPIALGNFRESDSLNTFEIKENADLDMRTFLDRSLTNYLHELAPGLSADDLSSKGNYQYSFYIDGKLVYVENLHPGAGLPENKNLRTVFRVPLISTKNEDSWGRFLWTRFMLRAGEDGLESGEHLLKIELRPYLQADEIKVGPLMAFGDLMVRIVRPGVEASKVAIQPIRAHSGWLLSRDSFDTRRVRDLNLKIGEKTFRDITSIIVAKEGKLLIEEYFNGATRNTLHDTRSVSKTITSALLGLAKQDGSIRGEDQQLGDFYDLSKFSNYSPEKGRVKLKELLTMTSVFDGSDSNEDSPGNEEKMYPTSDWVKFALDLPLDSAKSGGRQWDYFTAGVVVLGDILNRSVTGGLENYAERRLFRPLGIKDYRWEFTPKKVVNTAGGLRMRSLDLARFGQLYQNRGVWKGRRLLTQDWVNASLDKHIQIPGRTGEFYGYLFWNKTFTVNGRKYETSYCSGNGGSKIFIFHDIPFVVVITATAYNKPYAHSQVDKIMERYILTAVTPNRNTGKGRQK